VEVARLIEQSRPERHRSDMYREYLACLANADTTVQPTPEQVREVYGKGIAS
jgi:hypothetical protein